MNDRIELSKGVTGWNAKYTGPQAREIGPLFGFPPNADVILPTAFTTKATPETVLAEVSRLNPNCEVVLS
jgi:hypothetical protein